MNQIAVYRLFPDKDDHKTVLWASDRVVDMLAWYEQKKEKYRGSYWKKRQRFCEDGFPVWTGDGRPVVSEWNQVFRIGDGSLFRVIGFFADGRDKEFVAIDAYLKTHQQLNAAERARIEKVGEVRARGLWFRAKHNE